MRVVVTGAGGFVGRAVVQRLRASASVVGVDVVAGPGVDVCGDLGDVRVLESAFVVPPDAVLHLATWPGGAAEREPEKAWAVNVEASRLLAAMAADSGRCPRFVFASSIAVYGDPLPSVIDDTTPLSPTLLYGAHKAMLETWLETLTRRGAIDALSVRLSGIVARPRASMAMRSAFLSDLFHALSADESITLPVSPEATVALQSVGRVAENLIHALGGKSVGSLNLPALVVTAGELVSALAKATGSSAARVSWEPDPVIERQFGQVPPLLSPRANELGFRSDDSLETLVAAALDGLHSSKSGPPG